MSIIVIFLFTACYPSNGVKILGVLVTEFKSHYLNIRNVADELASRGHEVTLVFPSALPFPPSDSFRHSTYKLPFDKDLLENTFVRKSRNRSVFESLQDNEMWIDYEIILCRALIIHVQQHRDALKEFDLMFCDSPPACGAIISEILRLPRIDIKPAGLGMRFSKDLSLVSYIPCIYSSSSDKMNILERVGNLFYLMLTSAILYPRNCARCEGLWREFDDGGQRSYQDAINMAEMTIIMGHFALEYPQPILPGTKLVGPLTITSTNLLSRDLEHFISGAGNKGIILFSLGTLGDALLQKHQVDMLAETFRRLEQRIIWRLNRHIPDLSPNIKILPWIPQNDLLAHNSTKAFISHTSHNSLYEAAFYGVPLVCMPTFADQFSNCTQAQSVGMAIGIDVKTAAADEIYHSIRRILEEPSFKGNATRISRLLRDTPRTSLQQAADWIEYVHRHKGARHLRPKVHNLYWFQYYLLDVLAFLLTAIFAFYFAIRMLITLLSKIVVKQGKVIISSIHD